MHDIEAQSTLAPHAPLGSQVCWELPPTQRVSPGVQAVQSFPMQTPGVHAKLLPQVPFILQVCCVEPSRHCVSLGVQAVQAPEMHEALQTISLPSVPVLSQV
jgi:hypothetical protein